MVLVMVSRRLSTRSVTVDHHCNMSQSIERFVYTHSLTAHLFISRLIYNKLSAEHEIPERDMR